MPTDDIHILSSSDSRILISSNVTESSSIELTSYSIERIYYLLKTEKQQYTIIKNKISPPAGFYWSIFGFSAKPNKNTCIFERINGYTSCEKCKKTFVYDSNSGTTHMKQHPCVTDLITQTTSSSINVTLTAEQSKIIKDLIVCWICNDICPVFITEDNGLRGLVEECRRLVNNILRCRSTTSSHIQVVAESCHARIKNVLEEPYKNGSLPISPGFWCNKSKQICYLGVMAVVVDKDYIYYVLDRFCKQFQEYEKTSENI
ncbi:unnamed protein product [Rotaria sp. Silwood1]|nr:unnamed protein product [Rotaria sp. Silwood1]CAF1628923.1 unnamed protein product [Rotaria sp. Silwood1]